MGYLLRRVNSMSLSTLPHLPWKVPWSSIGYIDYHDDRAFLNVYTCGTGGSRWAGKAHPRPGLQWGELSAPPINQLVAGWLTGLSGKRGQTGAQHWFLPLAGAAASRWAFLLLSPCVASIVATLTTLYLGPLSKPCGGWRKSRLTLQNMSSCLPDYREPLLKQMLFTGHSHGTEMSSCFVAILRGSSTYPFPELLVTSLQILFFLILWPSYQAVSECPRISMRLYF